MGNFLETGYYFFAVIMLFNLQATYFGYGDTNDIIQSQATNGLNPDGTINLNQVNPTNQNSNPLLTSDPNAKPNSSDQISKDLYPDIITLISNLFFAFADTIEKSGLPNPLNFMLGFIVKIFTGAYLFFTALNIKNLLLGGGSSQ